MCEMCGKIERKKQNEIVHSPVASHSANCRDPPVSAALPGLGLQARTTTTQKFLFACFALCGFWGLNSGPPACTANTFRNEPPSPQLLPFGISTTGVSPHHPQSATEMRGQRNP